MFSLQITHLTSNLITGDNNKSYNTQGKYDYGDYCFHLLPDERGYRFRLAAGCRFKVVG